MSDSSSKQLVVFSLRSEQYALPIGALHEIIRCSEPPRAVVEAGLADEVLTLDELAGAVARQAGA